MNKLIIFIFCLVFSMSLFSQSDSAILVISIETIDSIKKPTRYLNITFKSQSSRPVFIISETSISDLFCKMNGAAFIEMEKLDSSCFLPKTSDCSPIYPYDFGPRSLKKLQKGDSVTYKFEIGERMDKKVLNPEAKAFDAIYRIRVHHWYQYDNKRRSIVNSDWVYIGCPRQ